MHQEIHVWPEFRPGSEKSATRQPAKRSGALALPFAPARLCASAGEAEVVPMKKSPTGGDGLIVEPVLSQHRQLKLFVTFPSGVEGRVNGLPAPRHALLSPGDCVRWMDGAAFHVTILNRPQVGPPTPEQIGKPCPVCRVPLRSRTVCYTCACGAALHHESGAPEALDCAQSSSICPRCQRPIVHQPAYVFTPEIE